MGYFKIKNITNSLPKRHVKKDSMVEIEYSGGFIKKSFKLNSGAEAYIEAGNLPISIHKLRMKGMISIVEVSKNDFYKKQKPEPPKVTAPKKGEIIDGAVEKDTSIKKINRKKRDINPTVISTPETEQ